MLIRRLPVYSKTPDIKNVEGGSNPPPTPSDSVFQQIGTIDSKIEKLLARLAVYNAPELAIFYDIDSVLTALRSPGIGLFTDTTATILTSPNRFANTIIRGIGIHAFDPSAHTDCAIRFLINNQAIPRYQTGIFTRGISAYDYTSPLEVYIVMPSNSTLQLTVRNLNSTTDYVFKTRVLGWYE